MGRVVVWTPSLWRGNPPGLEGVGARGAETVRGGAWILQFVAGKSSRAGGPGRAEMGRQPVAWPRQGEATEAVFS